MIVDRLAAAAASAAAPAETAPRPAPVRADATAASGAGSFSATLSRTQVQAPAIGRAAGLVRHEARKISPEEKFESFVLRSFVGEMLPSEDSGFFGAGMSGNVWRSMLAEQIGDELAASGGVGIADMLRARGTRGGHAALTAPPMAGPEPAELLSLSGASPAEAFADAPDGDGA